MNDYALMLARAVLGFEKPTSGLPPPAEFGVGQAEVEINLKAMVHGLRQRLWISNAELTAQVERKLIAACSDVSITKVVDEAIAAEFAAVKTEIRSIVRRKIERLVDSAIDQALGNGPERLAKRIASKMWDSFYNAAKR